MQRRFTAHGRLHGYRGVRCVLSKNREWEILRPTAKRFPRTDRRRERRGLGALGTHCARHLTTVSRWPVSAILDDKGRSVEIVARNDSAIHAIQQMNDHRIGSVLVADDDGLHGIFSERDALVRILGAGRNPTTTLVRDVMTRNLVFLSPSTTVERAMEIATMSRCRHLPVLDGDRLDGLVSLGDLVEWIVRDQKLQIEDLIRFITT